MSPRFGFNEAAINRSRKGLGPRLRPSIWRGASMRPRSIDRGREHDLPHDQRNDQHSFNEAAINRSRKGTRPTTTSASPSGFNEAAINRSRKGSLPRKGEETNMMLQ